MADLDDFPPPKDFIATMDLSLREITFKWSKSPAAPDCPSLHYNILASNCGSCPTTTTNTTVTCTDVPTNGSMCTFSIESVVCGKVVNLFNDTIHIPMNMTDTCSCDCGANIAIASTSLLAGISFVYATVVTVLMIVNKRKKQATRKTTTEQETPDVLYEDVELQGSASAESVMNTRVNIAYGHVMSQTGN